MGRKANNYESDRLTFQIPKDKKLKAALKKELKPVIKKGVDKWKKSKG